MIEPLMNSITLAWLAYCSALGPPALIVECNPAGTGVERRWSQDTRRPVDADGDICGQRSTRRWRWSDGGLCVEDYRDQFELIPIWIRWAGR